ncbi:nephrin-like [Penaeus indicus]|uniref:nephrin-like n=1 Tax=Penaeus indicus TaxID=29960 RepID=UPI00300C1198
MARQGNFLVVLQLIAVVVGTSVPLPKTKVRSGLENSPLTEVHAVEASRVLLPCEVKPPVPSDDTILVLFYRGSIGTPIYSIDGRNSPVRQSPHWKDEAALGSRAYFDLTKHPPGLVLDPVEALDEDEYVCRVDFRSSPTRNVRVKLHVVVPPTGIRLMNEANVDVSGVIGPYPVGATVTLKCQVVGGHPRPIVTWRSDGILLDDVSEGLGPDDTVNTLVLESLTRNDLYRVLTCQTANSNLTVPLAAAVTLDMSFPPLDVRILGSRNNPFSAGERYELVCESSGSRPSAKITWWKNGMLMTDARIQVFQEGNVSRSTLYLTPSPADNTVYISCRAENQQVPASGLEDVIKLDVHYSPRLSLLAGQNLDMDDIKEGDDVYFECNIVANPKVHKVQWYHNGDEITHNVSAGVILSNQSLVLQQVTKRSSGQYTCKAANFHGSSGSNAVQLSVKFAPLCRGGQKIVYGAGKHEEVNVTCNVEAHPEPFRYRWAFNSSSEVEDIPVSRTWVVGKGLSQASYTPHSHQEYGSLLCWARNDVGMQKQPCIYHVIHAASPDPVNNCTVENVSSTGAAVRCQAGWDGGLAQTFTLSVSRPSAHTRGQDKKNEAPRVLANTSTSPRPEFTLTGLQAGTEYVLIIMGVNKKGQSEPVRLKIFTLKDIAEKHTSPASPDPVNNCTVENVSSTGAAVRCQAGWDGGLAQTFTLSVSRPSAHTRGQDKKNEAPRVLANTSTSPRPEFTLTGLQAGTEYVLIIMGVNKKGQSEPVRLKIFTLKDIAEKHTSPVGGTLAFTSLLAVILGVVASLLLMAVVIVLVVRSRCAHVHKPEVKMVYNKGVASPSRGSDDDLNSDDPNPDVIPINDVKLHFLPDHLVKTTQQVHQKKHPQQNPQQDPTATASGAEPSPDPGPLPCHLEACADPQCHPLTDYDSFYINPGTLVRQKSATMAPVSDPMTLMGCPLAASTPTAAKSPPSLYPHPAHEVPLTYHGPPPPPYTHDTQRVAPLYTPHTLATAPSPSSFVCDTSFVPIPTSHPQDPRSANIPSSYASDISSLTPAAYPQYTLSLGRKGTLAMEGVVPSCIAGVPAPPHHGSTYSVVPKPEREWMRPHALALPPWDDTGREREPSPAHRESSV